MKSLNRTNQCAISVATVHARFGNDVSHSNMASY
jgi:hypothetical protein